MEGCDNKSKMEGMGVCTNKNSPHPPTPPYSPICPLLFLFRRSSFVVVVVVQLNAPKLTLAADAFFNFSLHEGVNLHHLLPFLLFTFDFALKGGAFLVSLDFS